MAHFKDLSRCTYFDRDLGYAKLRLNVLAIGWLEKAPRPSIRNFPPSFIEKLKTLISDSQEIFQFCGFHTCCMCPDDDEKTSSWKNVFVSSKDRIYIFPELIVHYIQDHGYVPPKEFIDAIMKSPSYGTDEYWNRVKELEPNLWWMERQRRGEVSYNDTAPWIDVKKLAKWELERNLKWEREEKQKEKNGLKLKKLPHSELVSKLKSYFMRNFIDME